MKIHTFICSNMPVCLVNLTGLGCLERWRCDSPQGINPLCGECAVGRRAQLKQASLRVRFWSICGWRFAPGHCFLVTVKWAALLYHTLGPWSPALEQPIRDWNFWDQESKKIILNCRFQVFFFQQLKANNNQEKKRRFYP